MKYLLLSAALLCMITLRMAAASAQTPTEKPADCLEGVLRVHPKFHYRYYINEFGAGQSCALLGADTRLEQIKPGSRIRVQGKLASKYFGDPKDKTPAVISTWVIYMRVEQVDVLRQPSSNASEPPAPHAR